MSTQVEEWVIHYIPEEGGRFTGMQAVRKGLFKQAVIKMNNGQVFVFDYALLSVGTIIDGVRLVISTRN